MFYLLKSYFSLSFYRKIHFLLYIVFKDHPWESFKNDLSKLNRILGLFFEIFFLHRKEVIHPHVPVGIPCYDLTPIISPTLGASLLAVTITTSGIANSHGLTGGVYKPRERIHRSVADLRLLAIPASWSRVADFNPNWDRLFEVCSPSRDCFSLYRPL